MTESCQIPPKEKIMRINGLLLTWSCFYVGTTLAADFSVAIDVGHSLLHPGAKSASGVDEFHFNQALAKGLHNKLKQTGISSLLIGDKGDITELKQRTQLAATQSLFISLHHDSVQPQYLPIANQYHGYSIFISKKNPYPDKSMACAHQIALQYQAAGLTPTLHHAEAITGENRPLADKKLGIYWFDDLIVLKTAHQPAVLVESGVIVNSKEEQWLASASGRKILTQALSNAIQLCEKQI
jgi:N-acetylmuramoyl-L-alanine amidase